MKTGNDPEISADVISRTIEQIYLVQESSEQWAALIEGILDLLGLLKDIPDNADSNSAPTSFETQLTQWLTPHLARVLEQQTQLLQQENVLDFHDLILDRHSLALGLGDTTGEILWANQSMRLYLSQLSSASRTHLLSLHTPRPSVSKIKIDRGEIAIVAVNVPSLGPNYVALIANSSDAIYLDHELLKRLFQLTDAEIRIAERLATGLSPDDIATMSGTSVQTVRGQVKSVMGKIGSNRQSELVSRLLSSPASLSIPQESIAKTVIGHRVSIEGRQIGYAEYGSPKGQAVFFMHSWAGSRLQVPYDKNVLIENNIRLIAIERPGMGLSEVRADSNLDNWPFTLVKIADHLKIEKFSIVGYSLGSIYAIACAKKLPERITQLYLVSPFAPLRTLGDLAGMLPSGQFLLGIAMRLPNLSQLLVKLWMMKMRRNPELYLDSVRPYLAAKDAKVMLTPWMREHYVHSFVEAIHQGDTGLLQELNVMASNWENILPITQEVTIWHGEDDSHIPLALSKKLSSMLPKSRIISVADSGHYLLYHHWAAIVNEVGKSNSLTEVSA